MRFRVWLLAVAGLCCPAAVLAQGAQVRPGPSQPLGLSSAGDPQPKPALSARCQHVAAPGRVLCEVETEVSTGKLRWADVVVLETPAFAKPLRARVALSEATTRTERRIRLPVALVATENGHGDVVFAARGVSCNSAGACAPFRREVRAELHVGPDAPRKEMLDAG